MSALNRALLNLKAPAPMTIAKANRNAKRTFAAITHPNATAEMALQYRNIIIAAARTVDKGAVDLEENVCWERLTIHVVRLIRYMRQGTEGLQKMNKQYKAQHKGIVIPTEVSWLANPGTIRQRRQNREIAMSSEVFVTKGSNVSERLVKKRIEAAGVRYRVDIYTNAGPDCWSEPCRRWGHFENRCGSKPKCGYC